MFDFGFSELILIAVVMLIVVGPERLPKVARTAGHMLGRLQRYVSDVKSDIQREMQLEDLKKLQQQVEQQARELESSVRGQMAAVESDLGKAAAEVKSALPSGTVMAPGEAAPPTIAPVAEADPVGPPEPGEPAPAESGPQLELGLDPARSSRQAAERT